MTSTDAARITREEAAYLHLAGFARGDAVDVGGESYFLPARVAIPQRDDGEDITAAMITVSGAGGTTAVTVADLLDGTHTVTGLDGAKAGNVRYFDEAGYAAQNG